MLLDDKSFAAIRDGRIDTVLRRWKRPTVKAGGTLTDARGRIAIEAVDKFEWTDIAAADLRRAGFASRQAAEEGMPATGQLYRIRVRYAGDDPRIALRADVPDAAELATLAGKLQRMDGADPWTAATLALIADKPGTRAGDLAPRFGLELMPFKARVRRLKALGLTESLEIGYRLSPRGTAVLRHIGAAR